MLLGCPWGTSQALPSSSDGRADRSWVCTISRVAARCRYEQPRDSFIAAHRTGHPTRWRVLLEGELELPCSFGGASVYEKRLLLPSLRSLRLLRVLLPLCASNCCLLCLQAALCSGASATAATSETRNAANPIRRVVSRRKRSPGK